MCVYGVCVFYSPLTTHQSNNGRIRKVIIGIIIIGMCSMALRRSDHTRPTYQG